jgi:hypothetical protein
MSAATNVYARSHIEDPVGEDPGESVRPGRDGVGVEDIAERAPASCAKG